MTGQELINHFKSFNGQGRTYNAYGEHLVIPVTISGKKTSVQVTEQSQILYTVWGSPSKGCRKILARVHFSGNVRPENALEGVEFR
jgi:hypothetical protein